MWLNCKKILVTIKEILYIAIYITIFMHSVTLYIV